MSVDALSGLANAFDQDGAANEARERLDEILRHGPRAAEPAPEAAPSLGILGRTLEPGDRLAVVGPSGCGKTTAIETLLGLRGEAPALPRWKAAFAWLPQDAGLDRRHGARQPAPWPRPRPTPSPVGRPGRRRARRPHPRRAAGLGRLSRRERRAAVGRRAATPGPGPRLLRDAPWLLLDEPTEGLDAATEALVERLEPAWTAPAKAWCWSATARAPYVGRVEIVRSSSNCQSAAVAGAIG
jgi:ATP-binding cassette subfamily C protein CydC